MKRLRELVEQLGNLVEVELGAFAGSSFAGPETGRAATDPGKLFNPSVPYGYLKGPEEPKRKKRKPGKEREP